MNLKLIRQHFTPQSTIGSLLIDGKFECFALEDAVRKGPKVHGKTAIPEGEYEVVITMSARFKRLLPLLVNVPGFEGIRIHSGNTHENTEGCLLPGATRSKDFVGGSRVAFNRLFDKLQDAKARKEKITILITSEKINPVSTEA